MKVYQRTNFVAAVLFAGVLIPVFTANAGYIEITLPYAKYGHVYNTDSGLAGGNPIGYCAPTATANSFVFLENQYPSVYGNSLTPAPEPGDINLRNRLATGWMSPGGTKRTGMYNPGSGGSSDKDWWEHKVWYIEDFAPNTTVFSGMIEANPAGWHDAADLIQGSPTWGFLWQEVADAENVEIKINIPGESLAHALTLTSMKFNDANDNHQWDVGEARWIDYLDPNDPSQLFTGAVQPNLAGTRLEFYWDNLGANDPRWVTISGAFSESPVPEPVNVALAIFGGIGAIVWGARRFVNRRQQTQTPA